MHKRTAKKQGTVGEVRPDYLKGKRFNAVMEIVKGEMGKYLASGSLSEVRKTVPRSENVGGGRFGITAVTSTWGNGETGPLGLCVSSGSLPQSFITTFNSDWYGSALIFESGTESHFMTADTTILYFQELLGPVTCHTQIQNMFNLCDNTVFISFSFTKKQSNRRYLYHYLLFERQEFRKGECRGYLSS